MSIKREQLQFELEQMGFIHTHTSGSHMVYKHPLGSRPVSICHNSKNKVFGPAAYKQVIKEARLSIQQGQELRLKRA